jgi:hypothetical protein
MFIEPSARQLIARAAYYGGPHFELGLQTFYPGEFCVQIHTETGGGVPCSIYQDAILPRPYHAIIKNHPTMDAIHFTRALYLLPHYDKQTWQ